MLVSRSSGAVPCGRRAARRRRGSPTQQPQHVGVAVGVAAAGADPDARHGHRRLRRRTTWRAWSAAPRRWACTARASPRPGVRRHAAQQLDHRRRRHRHRAVRAADPARRRPPPARRPARSSPRCTSPAQTPTTSAIASRAPTSWKCTSSGDVPWTARLRDREPLEGRVRPPRTASGRPAPREQRARRRARCGGSWLSATSTCSRVAAKPLRDTVSGRRARRARGRPRRPRSASTSSGTPAPTRAPSSMSPLAPEEASTQPITRSARRGGVAGHPGGEDAGAEAVVDVDDRDAGRAGVEHRRAAPPARRTRRRSRRWSAPRPAARRPGRRPRWAARPPCRPRRPGSRRLEQLLARGEQPVQPGDADVGHHAAPRRRTPGRSARPRRRPARRRCRRDTTATRAARRGQRAERHGPGDRVDDGVGQRRADRVGGLVGDPGGEHRPVGVRARAGCAGSPRPAAGSCRRRRRPRGRRCAPRGRCPAARSRPGG